MEFKNACDDLRYAEAYAKLEFPGTYYLAYRDLPVSKLRALLTDDGRMVNLVSSPKM